MIYKKVKYRWVSLEDSQYSDPINPSYLVLQDMEMTVNYETKSDSVSLGFWSKWGNTTAKDRTWRISGIIAEVDPAKRQYAIDYLKSIIKPEGILSKNPNYRIEWQDMTDRTFWSMARVSSEVTFQHQIRSPIISFSFELWSESPQYFGQFLRTTKITPWMMSFWLFTGESDGIHLWFPNENPSEWVGMINDWNFAAWVEIHDTSWADGVVYTNYTNGLQYGVSGTATDRIIDTTVRPTVVTDFWVDVSKNRMQWSSWFMLSEWLNKVSANIINYDFSNPPPTDSVLLSWYDTYI